MSFPFREDSEMKRTKLPTNALRDEFDASEYEQMLIESLKLNRYMTVNRALIQALGLIDACVFQSYLDACLFFLRKYPENQGWFFHPHEKICKSLNLNEKTVRRVKQDLIKMGLIRTRMMGAPAKEWIRLNPRKINELFLNLVRDAEKLDNLNIDFEEDVSGKISGEVPNIDGESVFRISGQHDDDPQKSQNGMSSPTKTEGLDLPKTVGLGVPKTVGLGVPKMGGLYRSNKGMILDDDPRSVSLLRNETGAPPVSGDAHSSTSPSNGKVVFFQDRKQEKRAVTHRILDHFAARFKEYTGSECLFDFGKDGSLAKRLVKAHGEEKVLELIDRFFDEVVPRDKFVQEAGISFGVFASSSMINKLVSKRSDAAAAPAPAERTRTAEEIVQEHFKNKTLVTLFMDRNFKLAEELFRPGSEEERSGLAKRLLDLYDQIVEARSESKYRTEGLLPVGEVFALYLRWLSDQDWIENLTPDALDMEHGLFRKFCSDVARRRDQMGLHPVTGKPIHR